MEVQPSAATVYCIESLIDMDYCIVYLSSSRGLLADDDLGRILKQSQRNNWAQGITGVLLYLNGCIIQVLEGDEARVNALYTIINRDPQHTQVTKLYSGPIAHRSFADWSMGYKTLSTSELDHLHAILPFTAEPASANRAEPNVILTLVNVFYRNNHRN